MANAADDVFPMQITLGHPVGCGQNAETVAPSAQNSDSKRSSGATNGGSDDDDRALSERGSPVRERARWPHNHERVVAWMRSYGSTLPYNAINILANTRIKPWTIFENTIPNNFNIDIL